MEQCKRCGETERLIYTSDGKYCYPCNEKRINKQIERFDGDTEYTRHPICPYCGYEDMDGWEWAEDEGTHQCGHCENEFDYTRDVTVDYTTYKKSPLG